MSGAVRLRGPTRRAEIRALGQAATYTHAGSTRSITLIFDVMSERQTFGSDGLPVVTRAPMAWVDGDQLAARPSAEGSAPDTITVDGASYTVREVLGDAIGGYTLILSADAEGLAP